MAQLDRFFISEECEDSFPLSTALDLASIMSDHCPINLNTHDQLSPIKPFKLEKMWLKEETLNI